MASRADVDAWIDAYERAWRTPGTEPLAHLFSDDARYRPSPYEEALRGRAAIAEFWEDERESPDEGFEMRHEIVAVEGDTGVVRVDIDYERGTEYRDLWVIGLAPDGRCSDFEEWPFWPEKGRTAEESG
jgi:ketosteroid isomerase-like protein